MPRPLAPVLPVRARIGLVSVAALITVGLAGCTSSPAPSPTPSTSSATSAPTASGSAQPAVFVPDGTAAENQAFFDAVNNGVIAAKTAANQAADGVAFTSALRDGGFAVANMQVTPDVTTVGVKADSIQFSVALKGQCLIGQYGFGQYHSIIAPVLGSGTCLIGQTRPIDW